MFTARTPTCGHTPDCSSSIKPKFLQFFSLFSTNLTQNSLPNDGCVRKPLLHHIKSSLFKKKKNGLSQRMCGYDTTIKISKENKVVFHQVLVQNWPQSRLEIIGTKPRPNITWNNRENHSIIASQGASGPVLWHVCFQLKLICPHSEVLCTRQFWSQLQYNSTLSSTQSFFLSPQPERGDIWNQQ